MAVRIGLAGAGRRAATAHAPSLAACGEARFAGVWAPRPEAARRLAETHGVPACRSFGELLSQCDAVAFAVPPAAQPALASAAARRGKAVLLESPVAGDLAGAQELVLAVTQAHVTSQVALMWRYAFAVRDFLSAGVPRTHPQGGSGRLVSAAFAAGSDVPAWRIEMGVLRSFGPYLIDLLDAALGRVGGVRAHGDPQGWLGLMLEHSEGRFSEASLTATATPDSQRADVEIFGSGGAAAVDCQAAAGQEAFGTMYRFHEIHWRGLADHHTMVPRVVTTPRRPITYTTSWDAAARLPLSGGSYRDSKQGSYVCSTEMLAHSTPAPGTGGWHFPSSEKVCARPAGLEPATYCLEGSGEEAL
ncbi:MAG TPA: Gfo/Idh/MocA family oxidoreductase [Streptosporangiaceae bacterium]|nr:Gfo/Idh/MocA family oxidoreductase [Streptosporangiaceae bacterium]